MNANGLFWHGTAASRLSSAKLVDVPQQTLQPVTNLFALTLERFKFFAELLVGSLRFFPGSLGFGKLLEDRIFLVAEPDNQLYRFLNAVFKVRKCIDFGVLIDQSHNLPYLLKKLRLRTESCLRLSGDESELRRVGSGGLGQHLAIEINPGELQTMHELAVGKPHCFASGGADANNPEGAELALFLLAASVGKFEGAFDSFLRRTVKLAFR